MLIANSLVDGFSKSNGIGQGIVVVQIVASVVMVAAIIGKWKELGYMARSTRRFLRDFTVCGHVLEYYIKRRPTVANGLEFIYKCTCERLMRLLPQETLALLAAQKTGGASTSSLTEQDVALVRGTCEHALDEEEIRVEHGMGVIATVVSLSPMLGLLGTVWGVLDAFYEMGSSGSANLATIAPSISSALVTTVVGLLIAIPGVVAFSRMNATIRNLESEMEGFVDELIGRIACEHQRKEA